MTHSKQIVDELDKFKIENDKEHAFIAGFLHGLFITILFIIIVRIITL